jgi:Flp pilus assembly pilin Flp
VASALVAEIESRIRTGFAVQEQGQTMAEYAVVLAVITIATVLVFQTLSGGIQKSLNKVIAILP